MMASGAALSFSAHAAKATTRVLVNASPEPVSNVIVSLLEDLLVAGVMALAFAFPKVALVVGLGLAVVSALFALVMFRAARAAWRKVKERRERRRARRSGSPPPPLLRS